MIAVPFGLQKGSGWKYTYTKPIDNEQSFLYYCIMVKKEALIEKDFYLYYFLFILNCLFRKFAGGCFRCLIYQEQ